MSKRLTSLGIRGLCARLVCHHSREVQVKNLCLYATIDQNVNKKNELYFSENRSIVLKAAGKRVESRWKAGGKEVERRWKGAVKEVERSC